MKAILKPRKIEIIEVLKVKEHLNEILLETENRKQEIVVDDSGIWLEETYSGEETIGSRTLQVKSSVQRISLEENDVLTMENDFYIVPNVPSNFFIEVGEKDIYAIKKINNL